MLDLEIPLELIEAKIPISSVRGRNKQSIRTAFAVTPVMLLLLPFAVGFLWYGIGVIGPTLSVMPATGLAPDSGAFIAFVVVYGRMPNFDDWMAILIGAGLTPFVAAGIAWVLVQLGWIGPEVLSGILSASGIGIAVATAIIAA